MPEQHAKTDPEGATNGAAWTATHRRMYKSTWENPDPGIEITTVDFVSLGTECAPFLIAITAE